jgi:hypothetical protein
MSAGDLSVVVVTHDQARELPRTLQSLLPPYQRGVERNDLEVIVVDNGSQPPVTAVLPPHLVGAVRVHRIDDAPASPARAANEGIALAGGDLIGLVIDGARMASPGLLDAARRAARIDPRAVVTAPAWHLGAGLQAQAADEGYDQDAEDALLAASGWEEDGYELFTIATPAASSGRGLFGAAGESSSLFLARELWEELGGLDERFELPGGGLVNHDLYHRACGLAGAQLVVVLGEGTFHQIHGGAATSGRITRDEMRADYEAITGRAHQPPRSTPRFVGTVPPQYLPYVAASVEQAIARRPS